MTARGRRGTLDRTVALPSRKHRSNPATSPARHEPTPDASAEGAWDRSGAEPAWRQSHGRLVADALRSWKGDPITMRLHFADEMQGAPPPASGSGKIQRAQAGALLRELQHAARPSPTPLYRGSHERPTGPQSWSSRRAVAAQWAGRNAGLVWALPRGVRGLRIADYTGSAFDAEREWIVWTEAREVATPVRANPVRARRGSDAAAKPRLTRGHMDLPAVREAAKIAARTTLRTGFSWREGEGEGAVTRYGRAEHVGAGNFGMVYRVDDARGPVAVKLPAAHDVARAAWSREKQTDWMRQEAGVANELAALGYSIAPRGVYTEFEGGTPAFVREWGEPATSLTGPEYADLERQLLAIEQRHGWRVHDDLALYRRADGTVFVGDVGFWEAPRPGARRKWDAMQSDAPRLLEKACRTAPVLSPEGAPIQVPVVTRVALLARISATHYELRKDVPPRGLDLKLARDLLDAVAAREAAGIPTAHRFRREVKMAQAMLEKA